MTEVLGTTGRAAGTQGKAPLVALASTDPLDPATFSGLSRRLFDQLAAQGATVTALATRDLRWQDALRGAVRARAVLGRAGADRRTPLVSPDWIWSRRGFEALTTRLAERLAALPAGAPVLQVGTQTDPSRARPQRPVHCITDCTVVQALAAGEFSVSRASRRVQDEAVECQREVFDGCRRILVLSEWTRRSVIDDYGIDPDRVVAVGAGANLSDPLPRTPDPLRPVVLFVGRDWEQKGGPLLLDAFRLARARVPHARLVVVGCTPPLGSEPGVEIVGVLDRRDAAQDERLRRLYAQATCFAILSRFDAFPNVVLEAGVAGVPVVSTDEGSRSEAVIDGVTGLLAARREPRLVADALVALLSDPHRADAMGRAAAAGVAQRFTWPVVGRRVADALELPC
ncbi:MAG TPA: glycosyltransferase family 4 protein [Acidimicrobiales bacterium]|nr:glycosyltransferase family 4 protein [Acidimicrobiales bacterium]